MTVTDVQRVALATSEEGFNSHGVGTRRLSSSNQLMTRDQPAQLYRFNCTSNRMMLGWPQFLRPTADRQ